MHEVSKLPISRCFDRTSGVKIMCPYGVERSDSKPGSCLLKGLDLTKVFALTLDKKIPVSDLIKFIKRGKRIPAPFGHGLAPAQESLPDFQKLAQVFFLSN